jgi:hypothetical protein
MTPLLLVLLAGCGADCEDGACVGVVALDAATIDECDGLCATIEVTNGKRGVGDVELVLTSDVDGELFGAKVTTANDGTAEVCAPGPFTPGVHQITALPCPTCTAEPAELEVSPFGAKYGLNRRTDPLDAMPWVPELTGLDDPPVLTPEPGSWDAIATMASSVIWWEGEQFVYYAGAADAAFELGVAYRSDPEAPLQRWEGNPLPLDEGEGGWNHYGQQAPHVIAVGDELWMYYTGASLSDGGIHIGVATSSDGLNFNNHPDNPVLTPTGELGDFDWRGVGHPSVVQRDGLFELWYASGTLSIGYALSTDGLNFERYCGNPVLEGIEGSWDNAEVKAPEVIWDGDRYWMTWSGCDECFQVGWAASNDGLRWIKHPDPIIPSGVAPWSSRATQSAFIEVDGDVWRYWYTGNDGELQSLGIAESAAPPP